MKRKFNQLSPKASFILSQISIFVIGMAVMFFVMAIGHKKNAMDILSAKLDSTAESMAAELRSNQAPNLPMSDEYGVFIVNISDGAVVIDHRKVSDDEKALWEGRRSKFIYEMQKQKRGWIVYPEKSGWGWNQRQKMIRYVPIDEMGWILAVEISRPTEIELYKNAVDGSSYGTILITIILGIGFIWIMTNKYSKKMKQIFSSKAEIDLSGLGAEEMVWDKLQPSVSSKNGVGLEKEAMGLDFQPIVSNQKSNNKIDTQPELIKKTMSQEQVKIESFQSMYDKDIFLQKKTVPLKDVPEVPRKNIYPSNNDQEGQKQPQKQPMHDLTINVSGVKSPALKKMIQQIRGK